MGRARSREVGQCFDQRPGQWFDCGAIQRLDVDELSADEGVRRVRFAVRLVSKRGKTLGIRNLLQKPSLQEKPAL